MQALQPARHLRLGGAQLLGKLCAQALQRGALLGQELMEGRVQEADGDGQAVHGAEDALKVLGWCNWGWLLWGGGLCCMVWGGLPGGGSWGEAGGEEGNRRLR